MSILHREISKFRRLAVIFVSLIAAIPFYLLILLALKNPIGGLWS